MDTLLPIFPLDLVLLPQEVLPLRIFEPRYKEMIGECLEHKRAFGIVRAQEDAIAQIGCTAEILAVKQKYQDGSMDIETAGRQAFEIVEVNSERSFLRAEVLFQEDEPDRPRPQQAEQALELHVQVVKLLGPNETYESPSVTKPQLSYELAGVLPMDLDFKQALLAMRSEPDRLSALTEFYRQVLPKLERAAKVRQKSRRQWPRALIDSNCPRRYAHRIPNPPSAVRIYTHQARIDIAYYNVRRLIAVQ